MEMNQIIKKPILTEKSYKLMDQGIYSFVVNKHVNKIEVRNAIEFIFDVEVSRVNIIKVTRKPKKVGKYSGFLPGYKKAIVKLSKGTINFFPEENKVNSKIKEAKIVEKKPTEISDAEKRAAEKIAKKIKEKEFNQKNMNVTSKSVNNIITKKQTNRGGDK